MNRDEVQSFLDARYVSAPKTVWRIFEFKMHEISHAIIRLAVHLPEEQAVNFQPGQEQEALEERIKRNNINSLVQTQSNYVGLLHYYNDTILNQRCTYHCRFMYDDEHQAFRGRFPHEIPNNEVVDENHESWID